MALSEVPADSGPMRYIPGSHREPRLEHVDTFDERNLLTRGQTAQGVDASRAIDVVLRPGEFAMHSITLVHGSHPNATANRRIGLALPYLAPHVRQRGGKGTATLVRGVDPHGHFELEPAPRSDLAAEAVRAHQRAVTRLHEVLSAGSDQIDTWTQRLERGTYRPPAIA